MLRLIMQYVTRIALTSIVLTNISHASGGIALGATRLIYNQDQKQASMPVVNSTLDKRYLINAWVEDASAQKTKSVIVTPPMFVSEAKAENTLRVVNTNQNLPQDRETLYYLNVQAIPSVSKAELEETNVLQLAILSRIKMMSRPANLSIRIEDAPSLLAAGVVNNTAVLKNPTPYFMTLVNISVDGVKQDNLMLEPFSEKPLKKMGSQVAFQTINDFGAFTDEKVLRIQ
ncbi:fimbria/pilus periplasmic chaperone [Acinetobacter larvae]|uniref:Molecular chaperone n=1 Tax=Acinetobacter larvae TaxID=1789224 RepID=A0A1B2M1C7_9GAMM|nr:fimbria/pilus periplasmic chaperone [Acinetobacter larvae]AOA58985.1 molecular chaperone [Acinetobacter larvae]